MVGSSLGQVFNPSPVQKASFGVMMTGSIVFFRTVLMLNNRIHLRNPSIKSDLITMIWTYHIRLYEGNIFVLEERNILILISQLGSPHLNTNLP